jgi:hypothetical protein
MQIRCPKCGQAIPGADIDLTARAAVCRPCGEIVAFSLPETPAPPAKLYKPADLRWAEESSPGRFEVTVVPPRTRGAFLAVFAAVWNVVIWVVIGTMIAHGHASQLPFLSVHFAMGLVIAFLAAAALLNRSRMVLDGRQLTVTRGPVWRSGAVRERTADIERLAVVEQSGSKAYWTRGSLMRGSSYGVSVLTRDGRSLGTHLSFEDRGQAEYAAGRMTQMLDDVRAAGTDGSPYRGVRVEASDQGAEGEAAEVAEETGETASARRGATAR